MPDHIAHQYRIIAAGAGWADRARPGIVRLDGTDRLSFLHALVTADVAALDEGQGAYAAYLTPQGRMITDLEILCRPGHVFALVPSGLAASLVARLDALVFAEDVQVTDATSDWSAIDITGGGAADLLAEVLGVDRHDLHGLAELAQIETESGFVMRRGDSPLEMYRVFVLTGRRDGVVARLESAGAIPLAAELVAALRIEACRPAWGSELSEDTIPLEAGLLDRAISTTKGCYVGQEVIIRILHRGGGRVARRLVQLALPASVTAVPQTGTQIFSGTDLTGRVTSAAFSPIRERVVALGYVRRDDAEVGKAVTIGESGSAAEIVGLGS
jgi:folate-binding protein YgfZ